MKEINTFIHQGLIKLINSDRKDVYNVTKDFFLNDSYSSKNHELFFTKLYPTLILIMNAFKHQIIIFE